MMAAPHSDQETSPTAPSSAITQDSDFWAGGPLPPHYEALISDSVLLRAFRLEERRFVMPMFRYRRLQAGELLFREGGPGDALYIVLEGALRVSSDADTESLVITILGPGEAVGEIGVFLGERRSAACRAIEDSIVAELLHDDVERLLAQHPGMALALGRLLSQRLREANQRQVPLAAAMRMLALGNRETITIGSDPTNDMVLAAPVAAFHSRITREGTVYRISEMSDTADLWINGRRQREAIVQDGDILRVGRFRLVLRDALGERSENSSVWLAAEHLHLYAVDDTPLLVDVSVRINPGQFVAITGVSGAGKTTLMNALTGFRPAQDGQVMLNGVSLYQNLDIFRRAVGFVPQDDIVHPELTVYSAFYYAARLRLPDSVPGSVIEDRIARTLGFLGLEEQSDIPIGQLSGGQRKRASIGVELITEPGLFCLDEPTAGLDPAASLRMMALLRQMSQRGQTVIMVTHDTETIGLFDQVIIMARGGRLAFSGSPSEAMLHFGVDEFNAIYTQLDHHDDESAVIPTGETLPALTGPQRVQVATAPRTVRHSGLRQFWVLVQRYAEIVRRDTPALTVILVQTPLIALLLWILFPPGIFSHDPTVGNPNKAISILFILSASAIFFGVSNASREVVKERAIFRRERFVGLQLAPYILSKAFILSIVGFIQVLLLLVMVFFGGLLPSSIFPNEALALLGIMGLTLFAGTSLGLVLSAISSSPNQATGLVPLVLLPQLMFGGTLVPLRNMYDFSKALAELTIAKWSFELLGTAVGMPALIASQSAQIQFGLHPYDGVFSAAFWPHAVVLFGMAAVYIFVSCLALIRVTSRPR